jgi:DNA-binding LytR/AlgR family response regulator
MTTAAPRAIVAEDEATLRHELSDQPARLWPELDVVAEASDGIQALRLIDEHRPEVVFLDIQMPGVTGLDVARQMPGRCHVVFVTAFDHYAVQAFDQAAVDYVLKPLSPARLFTAITRVRERLSGRPADISALLGNLPPQPRASQAPAYLRWINASVGQTLRLVTVDEVLYFQSDNKYTRVVTADSELLIRKPLKELVDELDPQAFWQVHRSTLVNAHAVASVTRDFRGRLQLQLKGRNDSLLVAESYAHLFRQM